MVKLLAFQPGPAVVYGNKPLPTEKYFRGNTVQPRFYDFYGLSDTDWLGDYLYSVTKIRK